MKLGPAAVERDLAETKSSFPVVTVERSWRRARREWANNPRAWSGAHRFIGHLLFPAGDGRECPRISGLPRKSPSDLDALAACIRCRRTDRRGSSWSIGARRNRRRAALLAGGSAGAAAAMNLASTGQLRPHPRRQPTGSDVSNVSGRMVMDSPAPTAPAQHQAAPRHPDSGPGRQRPGHRFAPEPVRGARR